MLFSYPALAAPAQSPREIYVRTLLGGIEMVRSGATCVVDFLYELQGFTDESLEAVVHAYRDLGLRALIALGMADRAYHETVVLDEHLVSALADRAARAREAAELGGVGVVQRATRSSATTDRTKVSRSGSAPRGRSAARTRCSPAAPRSPTSSTLPIHIHVLETRMQAVSGQRMYGRDAARAPGCDRLPRAARQLRARHLADRARHRARRATPASRSSTTRSRT